MYFPALFLKPMFGSIKRIGNNLKQLNSRDIVKKVLSEPSIQTQAIDLNQSQMYEKGVDSKGFSMGEYSPATIYGTKNFEGKIAKGQRYDHVTLKDTGAFYDSMKIVNSNDQFVIVGDLPEGAQRQWPDALGLTNESKDEIMPEIKERIIESIKQKVLK